MKTLDRQCFWATDVATGEPARLDDVEYQRMVEMAFSVLYRRNGPGVYAVGIRNANYDGWVKFFGSQDGGLGLTPPAQRPPSPHVDEIPHP